MMLDLQEKPSCSGGSLYRYIYLEAVYPDPRSANCAIWSRTQADAWVRLERAQQRATDNAPDLARQAEEHARTLGAAHGPEREAEYRRAAAYLLQPAEVAL